MLEDCSTDIKRIRCDIVGIRDIKRNMVLLSGIPVLSGMQTGTWVSGPGPRDAVEHVHPDIGGKGLRQGHRFETGFPERLEPLERNIEQLVRLDLV